MHNHLQWNIYKIFNPKGLIIPVDKLQRNSELWKPSLLLKRIQQDYNEALNGVCKMRAMHDVM